VDGLADAHRRLTAEVVNRGDGSGVEGVSAWRRVRGGQTDRISTAVDSIVASGLTLSKVTVAASLLGDLARA
jgi:glutamate dehydrogenase